MALAAADGDPAIEAFCWGSRGMLAVLAEDSSGALGAFGRPQPSCATAPARSPRSSAGCGRCCWPPPGMTGPPPRSATCAAAASPSPSPIAACSATPRPSSPGGAGDAEQATALAAAAQAELARYPVWIDLARRYAAEAALADGWGEPRRWLRAARDSFASRGMDRLARRCDRLLGSRPRGGGSTWGSPPGRRTCSAWSPRDCPTRRSREGFTFRRGQWRNTSRACCGRPGHGPGPGWWRSRARPGPRNWRAAARLRVLPDAGPAASRTIAGTGTNPREATA